MSHGDSFRVGVLGTPPLTGRGSFMRTVEVQIRETTPATPKSLTPRVTFKIFVDRDMKRAMVPYKPENSNAMAIEGRLGVLQYRNGRGYFVLHVSQFPVAEGVPTADLRAVDQIDPKLDGLVWAAKPATRYVYAKQIDDQIVVSLASRTLEDWWMVLGNPHSDDEAAWIARGLQSGNVTGGLAKVPGTERYLVYIPIT